MSAETTSAEAAVYVPIATGLFTWPSEQPRLIASRRRADMAPEFPAIPGDEEVLLSRAGTLFTWTTQQFRPPSPPYRGPEEFEPFTVGYVEFPEGVLVEGRITTSDIEQLWIGRRMDVVVTPFRTEPDGTVIVTFAFAPASDSAVSKDAV